MKSGPTFFFTLIVPGHWSSSGLSTAGEELSLRRCPTPGRGLAGGAPIDRLLLADVRATRGLPASRPSVADPGSLTWSRGGILSRRHFLRALGPREYAQEGPT